MLKATADLAQVVSFLNAQIVPMTVVEIANGTGLSIGLVRAALYSNQEKFIKSEVGGRHHPHRWANRLVPAHVE